MSITASQYFSDDAAAITPEAEDRFFAGLKTGNNTFKRTAKDRFKRIDDRCTEMFTSANVQLSHVLDIGISSGTTTLALSKRLALAGQTPQIVGTDLSLGAYLLDVFPGLRVLVDEQGLPLQYELLGRAVRAWVRRADYVTGVVILLGLLRALVKARVRRHLRYRERSTRKLWLLSRALRDEPRITVQRNDVFQLSEEFVGRFDFIRAANILNRGYFGDADLRRALGNVVRYLSGPGAWLLVARSEGAKTAGTLFRLSPDGSRLIIMARVGTGSEIESLVLNTPIPSPDGAA